MYSCLKKHTNDRNFHRDATGAFCWPLKMWVSCFWHRWSKYALGKTNLLTEIKSLSKEVNTVSGKTFFKSSRKQWSAIVCIHLFLLCYLFTLIIISIISISCTVCCMPCQEEEGTDKSGLVRKCDPARFTHKTV